MFMNRERLRLEMERSGFETLVATSKENVFYASGFTSLSQKLIKATQVYAMVSLKDDLKPVVISPVGDADLIASDFPVDHGFLTYGTFYYEIGSDNLPPVERKLKSLAVDRPSKANAQEALISYLQEAGLGKSRIGLDESNLNQTQFQSIRGALPGAEVVPAARSFRYARMVKTPREIELLHRAVACTEHAMEACLKAAAPGITEQAMGRIFDRTLIDEGAEPLFAVIAFGERGALPNAPATARELKPGDTIRFDIGCVYGGYTADIARTAAFGEVDPRLKAYYQALLTGENAGLEVCRPGRQASEVFNAVVEAVRKAGIPRYRRHHVGHGIGLEPYDAPLLGPADDTVLEEGMVLCVEPPYYELGVTGLQVEDTIVVEKSGARLLTRTTRELCQI